MSPRELPGFLLEPGVRVQFGEFTLDAGSRQLLRDGQEVHLVPKGFDLLQLLLERRPDAVSKQQIRDRLWPDTFVSESTLSSLVTDLRTALGDDAQEPRFVRTVYGRGYAFAGAAAAASGSRRSHRFRLFSEDREIVLREGENVLGRDEDAAVRIDSTTASRRHARIVVAGERATLEDLGSRNGTYHRGERVTKPRPLGDGDEIRIGRTLLTVRVLPGGLTTEVET
jgi:DNA-binding winged helix-turn-helix (wHTH) protein